MASPETMVADRLITTPCLINDLPSGSYHSAPGVSASNLKAFRRTPAHYVASLSNRKETPALRLGSLFHTATLEPDVFEKTVVVSEKFDRRTTVGKAMAADFEERNTGKTIIDSVELETVQGMAKSIREHKEARKRLGLPGKSEVSAFVKHEETGLLLRSRFDWLPDEGDAIVDLKSTEDASASEFMRTLVNYRYYVQAAYYIDNARRAGREINRFIFIVAEKSEPFAVAVYELGQDAIQKGREEYQAQLSLFAECVEFDSWPAYSAQLEPITLPEWAFNK